MIKKIFFDKEFVMARFVCYIMLVVLLVIMLFFDPFTYFCNQEGYTCLACGIKTGIYYILNFQFDKALNSNQFMPYLVALGIVILIDMVISIKKMLNDRAKNSF